MSHSPTPGPHDRPVSEDTWDALSSTTGVSDYPADTMARRLALSIVGLLVAFSIPLAIACAVSMLK